MSFPSKPSLLILSMLACAALGRAADAPKAVGSDTPVVTSVPADAKAAPAEKKSATADKASGNASGSASGKTCEDLKSDIDAKIKAKGVKAFTLDIVPAADVKDAKVVGSCEGGKKKVVYKRG